MFSDTLEVSRESRLLGSGEGGFRDARKARSTQWSDRHPQGGRGSSGDYHPHLSGPSFQDDQPFSWESARADVSALPEPAAMVAGWFLR